MVKKMGEGRRKEGCREEERREVKSKKKGKKKHEGNTVSKEERR